MDVLPPTQIHWKQDLRATLKLIGENSFLIGGGIVVFAALMTEVLFQPPYWLHALLWLPLILMVTLAPLRLLKGLLIALQYHHKAEERRFEKGPS